MSDRESDPELTQLLTDLTTTLRELEREVASEQPRGPRLPTPSELSRFTSEVAIPGLILILRTNIQALQLLQRALRLADGRNPSPDGPVTEARNRAEEVGRASLTQLEDVLTDLQSALEARPENEQADELLTRARDLRKQVQDEITEDGTDVPVEGREGASDEESQPEPVDIDIESELQSLKNNIEEVEDDSVDEDDDEDGAEGDENGDDDGEDDDDGNR